MQKFSLLVFLACGTCAASAQTGIGTVSTAGAQVQGNVSVSNGKATLQNSATVSAGSGPSDVALSRGGTVRVCAGSVAALSRSNATTSAGTPLLIALERGAMEVQTRTLRTDAVLTPDLRLEFSGVAPLDLRLRVNPAGDTCVENLGRDAPILHVTEQFSGAGYLVKAGQRVLFEHGSVREVVDRQRFGCGCPRPNAKDDFPEAVSAGMTQPAIPAVPAGQTHVQVSTAIQYDGNTQTASGPPNPDGSMPATAAAPTSGSASGPPVATPSTPVPVAAAGSNPFRAIGRFFRRLFGGGQ